MLGDGNASTLTYNFGGAAAGIDYRLDPRFLVGLGVGYTTRHAVGERLPGPGLDRQRQRRGLRLASRSGGFYADALAGYAYFNNQLQRQISIPGLQPRTANGSTGANQFLGQVETGYRLGVYAPAAATRHAVRAAAGLERQPERLHRMGRQLAQPERRSSRRRTRCARCWAPSSAGAIGLGNERARSTSALRLGWLHEYADTGRPITAAFAGAPRPSFTVYGATPQRDAAVIGFPASDQRRRAPRSSTCATTARSAAAPTTLPSMSACASPGEQRSGRQRRAAPAPDNMRRRSSAGLCLWRVGQAGVRARHAGPVLGEAPFLCQGKCHDASQEARGAARRGATPARSGARTDRLCPLPCLNGRLHSSGRGPGGQPPVAGRPHDASPGMVRTAQSNRHYAEQAETLDAWTARIDERARGLLLLKRHSTVSAEIYWLGVDPDHHRRGSDGLWSARSKAG